MIIPKLSGNINLCNFKRLPKFERCGLSLLTATPTVPRLMPHPVHFNLKWSFLESREYVASLLKNIFGTAQETFFN